MNSDEEFGKSMAEAAAIGAAASASFLRPIKDAAAISIPGLQ